MIAVERDRVALQQNDIKGPSCEKLDALRRDAAHETMGPINELLYDPKEELGVH